MVQGLRLRGGFGGRPEETILGKLDDGRTIGDDGIFDKTINTQIEESERIKKLLERESGHSAGGRHVQ